MHLRRSNWFPGHMAKGLRQLRERISEVDYVVELRDARIPFSSRNPHFRSIVVLAKKQHILLLSKCDLACSQTTKRVLEELQQEADAVFPSTEFRKLITLFKKESTVWVCGMPNVGKSTLINKLRMLNYKKKGAATGGLPGLTKSSTKMKLFSSPDVWLYDSPGILDPNLRCVEQFFNLMAAHCIPEKVFCPIDLAEFIFLQLRRCFYLELKKSNPIRLIPQYPMEFDKVLANDYTINQKETKVNEDAFDLFLKFLAPKIGCLSGGVADRKKTSLYLINAFRKGKLGQITLDAISFAHN